LNYRGFMVTWHWICHNV